MKIRHTLSQLQSYITECGADAQEIKEMLDHIEDIYTAIDQIEVSNDEVQKAQETIAKIIY